MYKFINPLKNKLNNTLRNNFRSEDVSYWRQRLLGSKVFSWKNFKFFAIRFVVWFLVFCALLFIWFAKDLPTPGKIILSNQSAPAQIFDRNGKPVYALYGGEKRFDLSSQDIPAVVKNATITAEDRDFYKHFGIDFKSLARAAYYDIFRRSGNLQGGSTITQQFVKNSLLSPQRTFSRKIKEAILSIEIETIYSKDKILTMYLNEIPYGNNSYGIQAAAKTYFGKNAKDLNLAEAATLAALPQRPTYFSPYGTHPDQRIARVDWILDNMVVQKYASQDEVDKAKIEAKNMTFAKPNQYISAPHFVQYVKEILVDKYGEKMVESGGLKVTTTLDLDKQAIAEQTLSDSASRLGNIKATNAALVSIDPKTGQIVAMAGSIDYFNNEIDGQVNVADSLRQPGSSFKPIVYATAFKDKYNPASILWDVPTDFGNYRPQNYDGTTRGPVTMRQALAGSLNIPAVKTLFLAGLTKSLQTAHDMGITSLNEPDRYGLSLVLGGGEVKLIDLTTAYGVFANAGSLAPTTSILKVEDSKGKILEEYKTNNAKEVLDPQIAYEISSILSDNNARAFVFGSNSPLSFSDRQVAVKTGTTNGYKDAWTIGYTPQLATGVWVGNNNGDEMTAGAAGAMAAAPIWHQFMASALSNVPKEDFQRPNGITQVSVDKLSNKLPTQNSPEIITDIFAKWQIPNEKANIYQSIKIDKATGFQATPTCPDIFTESKLITDIHSEQPSNPAWENPVRAAAEAMGFVLAPPAGETTCSVITNNDLGVKIISPANNANVSPDFTVKITIKSPIKKVELVIDNKTVGVSATAKSYNFSVKKLSSGIHTLTAVATDPNGVIGSSSINVTVTNITSTDKTAPANASGISVTAGLGSAVIKWQFPADKDLTKINIYVSENQGDLGSLVTSIGSTPSAIGTVTITTLNSSQTYWFTLRTVDSSGNENNNSTQYSALIL